jgi:hypothetical protein
MKPEIRALLISLAGLVPFSPDQTILAWPQAATRAGAIFFIDFKACHKEFTRLGIDYHTVKMQDFCKLPDFACK